MDDRCLDRIEETEIGIVRGERGSKEIVSFFKKVAEPHGENDPDAEK